MITINIQKKEMYLLSAIIVFLVGVGIIIAYNSGDPALMGHTVDEIDWSENISQLNALDFCLSGNCRTDWPSGGGGLWTSSGNNIYYNNGLVGIGTTNPSSKLDVDGIISTPEICLNGNCRTDWPTTGGDLPIQYSATGSSASSTTYHEVYSSLEDIRLEYLDTPYENTYCFSKNGCRIVLREEEKYSCDIIGLSDPQTCIRPYSTYELIGKIKTEQRVYGWGWPIITGTISFNRIDSPTTPHYSAFEEDLDGGGSFEYNYEYSFNKCKLKLSNKITYGGYATNPWITKETLEVKALDSNYRCIVSVSPA